MTVMYYWVRCCSPPSGTLCWMLSRDSCTTLWMSRARRHAALCPSQGRQWCPTTSCPTCSVSTLPTERSSNYEVRLWGEMVCMCVCVTRLAELPVVVSLQPDIFVLCWIVCRSCRDVWACVSMWLRVETDLLPPVLINHCNISVLYGWCWQGSFLRCFFKCLTLQNQVCVLCQYIKVITLNVCLNWKR